MKLLLYERRDYMFACKGVKLAHFLISHSLLCKSVELDKSNPEYLVYLFEKTEQLDIVMKMWQANR